MHLTSSSKLRTPFELRTQTRSLPLSSKRGHDHCFRAFFRIALGVERIFAYFWRRSFNLVVSFFKVSMVGVICRYEAAKSNLYPCQRRCQQWLCSASSFLVASFQFL